MWFTPGPGWVSVIVGLTILSPEFGWACRLLKKIQEKGIRVRNVLTSRAVQVSVRKHQGGQAAEGCYAAHKAQARLTSLENSRNIN